MDWRTDEPPETRQYLRRRLCVSDECLVTVRCIDGTGEPDYYTTTATCVNGVWTSCRIRKLREFGEVEVVAWMPMPEPYKGGSDGLGKML